MNVSAIVFVCLLYLFCGFACLFGLFVGLVCLLVGFLFLCLFVCLFLFLFIVAASRRDLVASNLPTFVGRGLCPKSSAVGRS